MYVDIVESLSTQTPVKKMAFNQWLKKNRWKYIVILMSRCRYHDHRVEPLMLELTEKKDSDLNTIGKFETVINWW